MNQDNQPQNNYPMGQYSSVNKSKKRTFYVAALLPALLFHLIIFALTNISDSTLWVDLFYHGFVLVGIYLPIFIYARRQFSRSVKEGVEPKPVKVFFVGIGIAIVSLLILQFLMTLVSYAVIEAMYSG